MITDPAEPAGQRRASWTRIGPGMVVAATGVGSGDLVATLIAGERFGYALLWAAIVGCMVKISLAEATGRWHLATGRTIFDGWTDLGRWTHFYFGPYIVIWGFVYGAAGMSASALPLATLFPFLPFWIWAVIAGVTGLVFVWFNQYPVFEKAMTVFVALMFLTVVGLAIFLTPNIGEAVTGIVPTLPAGSTIYTLGLIGGVGGTITMAAYGYWMNAKGWHDATWMKVMRLDNRVAYIMTGIFVISMLVVGAELLHLSNVALTQSDRGLLELADILQDRFGKPIEVLFLVGFFSAAFSSVLGVWHGVSLMFADFVGHLRGRVNRPVEEREQSLAFRGYLLWLTFPPMLLLVFGRPFQLILIYGVLGAFFMPFLALTLLWLLNSKRVPAAWRNGRVSNLGLAIAGLLFIVVSANEFWTTVRPLFGF